MTRRCSVGPCDRPAQAKGFCQSHYYQWRKTGVIPTQALRVYRTSQKNKPCSVEWCNELGHSRGFCRSHYANFTRCGDPLGKGLQRRPCAAPTCEASVVSATYCGFHARRAKRGMALDAPRYGVVTGPCRVDGCADSSTTRRGLCPLHDVRLRRTGDVGPAGRIGGDPAGATGECEVVGCGLPAVSKHMCNPHYKRYLTGRDLAAPLRVTYAAWLNPCSQPNCDRPARSRGLCQPHYHQARRQGALRAPSALGWPA